jgi:hypothetical protein
MIPRWQQLSRTRTYALETAAMALPSPTQPANAAAAGGSLLDQLDPWTQATPTSVRPGVLGRHECPASLKLKSLRPSTR